MNFWKNKNVLLTGADGFVGSHSQEKLIDLGAKLTIVVRATSNHGTSAYNFKNLPTIMLKNVKELYVVIFLLLTLLDILKIQNQNNFTLGSKCVCSIFF